MFVRAVTIISLHAATVFLMALSYADVPAPAPELRPATSAVASLTQELRIKPL